MNLTVPVPGVLASKTLSKKVIKFIRFFSFGIKSRIQKDEKEGDYILAKGDTFLN